MPQSQPPPSTIATSFLHNIANTPAFDHHYNSCLLCRAIISVVYNNHIEISFRLLRASFFLHHHIAGKLHGCTIFAPHRARWNACTHLRLVFSVSSRSPLQHRSHNLRQPCNTATTRHFRRATTSSSAAAPTIELHGFLFAPLSTLNHYSTRKPPWGHHSQPTTTTATLLQL
ncbi:hypothetical protein DEO72_LG11g1906 [Vigna unguiculata]|uniref:Uncharacterized protein n=1 Tax=Vigna unguiculata TaxID=3917 RepID=A0A4D6NM50_VIGUN|nr:hypothetical protein DEO72_LG11g1906 [Vigna unguiculata]